MAGKSYKVYKVYKVLQKEREMKQGSTIGRNRITFMSIIIIIIIIECGGQLGT